MKIEVGKKYELNDGTIAECTRMHGGDPLYVGSYGYGPFVVGGALYHQNGTFADGNTPELDVKREVLTIHPTTPERDPELTSPYGDGNHPLPDLGVRDKVEVNLKDFPHTIKDYDPEVTECEGHFFKKSVDSGIVTGTLAELNVKPGDVVELVSVDGNEFIGTKCTIDESGNANSDSGLFFDPGIDDMFSRTWRIISRASDTAKTWGEMTDAEKGDSATMEAIEYIDEVFDSKLAQRVRDELGIKPEPKSETVTLYHGPDDTAAFTGYKRANDDVVITYTRIDGKPDQDSIKMEALG